MPAATRQHVAMYEPTWQFLCASRAARPVGLIPTVVAPRRMIVLLFLASLISRLTVGPIKPKIPSGSSLCLAKNARPGGSDDPGMGSGLAS